MTQDMTDIAAAIGKLQGTVETEHEHTRKQLGRLFEKVEKLNTEGCTVGKDMKEKMKVVDKKLLILGFVVASIVGIDKLVGFFI